MGKKRDTVVAEVRESVKRHEQPDLNPQSIVQPGSAKAHELAPGKTHHPIYDGLCSICVSPLRLSIEKAYERDSIPKVSEHFNINKTVLELHARALDLDVDRLDKTDKMAAKIQELGYQRLEQGLEAVTVDQLIRISEHKDKKEGRIINRVAITKPSVIVFRGIPSPTESLEDSDDVIEQITDEMETPLLPASVKEIKNDKL